VVACRAICYLGGNDGEGVAMRWLLLVGLLAWGTSAVSAQGVDPLEQPREAIQRAIVDAGYSPAARSPLVRVLLEHPEDLVGIAVRDDPAVVADAERFRVALRENASSALHGGQIFGGWDRADLRAWAQSLGGADLATDPGRARLAARLSWDDELSIWIASVSLHGGMSPQVRQALDRPLAGACVTYRYQIIEQQPGQYASCLEYIAQSQ
jgi:hypothetical protein